MSDGQSTAADPVHSIFGLQRALRTFTAASMRHSEPGPDPASEIMKEER